MAVEAKLRCLMDVGENVQYSHFDIHTHACIRACGIMGISPYVKIACKMDRRLGTVGTVLTSPCMLA